MHFKYLENTMRWRNTKIVMIQVSRIAMNINWKDFRILNCVSVTNDISRLFLISGRQDPGRCWRKAQIDEVNFNFLNVIPLILL